LRILEGIMSVRLGRWIAGGVALAVATGACGSKTPTAPSTTATLTGFAVTGTPPLVGATSQFVATARLSNSTTQDVTSQATWASSDETIATVSSGGLVEGLSPGQVKISATYKDVPSTYTFTLKRAPATLSGIAVSGFAPTTGGTSQFTAAAVYSDGSSVDVTSQASWTSSSSAVATVSSTGVVTGVSRGAATVSATYHDLTGSATFNVGTTLSLVVVSGTAPAIGAGNQFTAMARFDDGSIQDVTKQAVWTSSNSDLATVGADGVVTGVAAGVVTISARYQNKSGSATFNIVGS
jgi:uncharacterized protein YjdB